jgi:hypothetical protein
VLTALSVERSSSPETVAGAFERLARSEMNELPLAVCFPRDDGEFAARVQTLLAGSHPEWPFAAAVQALLRETYPLAVVSPRHELGALDGRPVLYAFRDFLTAPDDYGDTS